MLSLLQYAPNLTLTQVEDQVRTTHRDIEESRKAVDGSAHVLIAADGLGNSTAPSHHNGDRDDPGRAVMGRNSREVKTGVGGTKTRNGHSRTRTPTVAAAVVVMATMVVVAAAAIVVAAETMAMVVVAGPAATVVAAVEEVAVTAAVAEAVEGRRRHRWSRGVVTGA